MCAYKFQLPVGAKSLLFIMHRFDTAMKVFIIEEYHKHRNAELVRQKWIKTFLEIPPPVRKTIYELRDRFHATGTVADLPRSGRPRSARTSDNADLVASAIVETAGSSSSGRKLSAQLAISRTTLRRILKDIGVRHFHATSLHGLLEDDPDRRFQMCSEFLVRIGDDADFVRNILWSDEAQFKLDGSVNRHNCVYYAYENPHLVQQTQLNQPGITVWAALSTMGVIGPYFFVDNVKGDNYLEMLTSYLVPQLQQRGWFRSIIFMQDGAPPHWALKVRDYLNATFPDRWIGRRGAIEWAPRSPDLTPMDFFFWGVLKDRVYQTNPRTICELRTAITREVERIATDIDLCDKVCMSVPDRMEACIRSEGGHFEHLR